MPRAPNRDDRRVPIKRERERDELTAKPRVTLPSPRFAGTCYDNFAIAKRFHKENLRHQPLPDRVDDRVFANPRRARSLDLVATSRYRRPNELGDAYRNRGELGCKAPATRMDLAICWDAPKDPAYEPRRPIRIDGSNGGPAPAIFALVQRAISVPAGDRRHEELHRRCARRTDGPERASPRRPRERANDDLCDEFEEFRISGRRRRVRSALSLTGRRRECAACARGRADKEEDRLRSFAVSRSGGSRRGGGRHGLPPSGANVPRPRTPYARRSFCIDTLTPPFSIVDGCRDADYPEHWRLTSVYRQSYGHPCNKRRSANECKYNESS